MKDYRNVWWKLEKGVEGQQQIPKVTFRYNPTGKRHLGRP